MPEPRLSIVTITYKDSKGLRETLESLRALGPAFESGCPWELVIVDSSPTENAATLAPLRGKISRLVHLTTPAEGVYAAINAGLAKACGEYVWFLNGGDRLRDRAALATALEAFRADEGCDLIASGVELQRDGGYLYLSVCASKYCHGTYWRFMT
ncbi:MAG: glycosyltransferase [Deltaproteobacteria bacterium]|nr:glycosyltransferase [Deltaproteobacteria bacterium]